ncbi:MAG: hypothetical protein JXL81_07670, partial [Deltaproteobacteria bacterium]|nr:hypothetical protein [Deltaproteobacteria bacterium]
PVLTFSIEITDREHDQQNSDKIYQNLFHVFLLCVDSLRQRIITTVVYISKGKKQPRPVFIPNGALKKRSACSG